MDSNGILWLGAFALVIVAFMGGRVTISSGSVKIDTKGLLEHLRSAERKKGGTGGEVDMKALPARKYIAKILWVDDHPINNQEERLAFADYGVFCDSYTNNGEALEAFDSGSYELVLSDIGRDSEAESGWNLLAEIRKRDSQIPFGFYTIGIDAALGRQASAAGATAIVEKPSDLFVFVVSSLGRATRRK